MARVTLLKVLGERHAASQWDAVLAATADEDQGVSYAATVALGSVGTTPRLPELVELYLTTEDAKIKSAAARAIISVARAEPAVDQRCVALIEAYKAGASKGRQALLKLLAALPGKAALGQVAAASLDQDAEVRNVGIRALCKWPDDSAADAMLTALKASQDKSQRPLLVRALTRVVSEGTRNPKDKLALYRDTLTVAGPEEKKVVLEAVTTIRSRAALDFAVPMLDDPDLGALSARVVALSACPGKGYAGLKEPTLRPALVKAAALLEDPKTKAGVEALLEAMPAPPAPVVVPVVPNEDGFVSLFNGKDLAGWQGETNKNIAQEGMIVARNGKLFTDEEYANFVLKFQFKLTPGANNGIAIRWPGKGDPAYAGYELQVLDNTAEKYAKLKAYQYHGSIYSLSPAKRGFLKPVGEWNEETIIAKGDVISVILNGETIVDAVDVSEHGRPERGYIGFCGHGDTVMYRNLRIKELHNIPPRGFAALWNGKDLNGWWGEKTTHYKQYRDLSLEAFKARQEKSREDTGKHWRVEGDDLVNDGHGLYLTTDKVYGDFELRVDYNTVAGADSGIYLRGIPQVQIWDFTEAGGKWKLGADKGSGGLWNNPGGSPGKDPSVLADKPFGEWNRFRIVMQGSKVNIWLNNQQVVDDATLSNYFDRKGPLPADGPIQLQTHGGQIRWRNVFIKELVSVQK